ncbi:MAG: N-acetylmuramic acid 6-phosphate etherase [Yokenella regensburgei]|jgi:N-acetylmuramic acid 6-phosphate etherase|uniref:N-acetylmuramic acid 6-phosphate etherase n=1 Tax=Yokenella regensburgei TaxID=158877 RepID=A0ABX9S821_9ENTR|nr:N-acetylmuramic acid 6-phosphate etherase [Yokenella regensburgei]MDR3103204.1 N-acetylmuramic acid 6-phosphate etherase [Yokenella regensburgei]RKR65505.1 N-acetylmuramic acid 6-phosphate etherase [Yokenella regensburgei]VFS15954.1 N-acetylmuramic acid 6-phosphate etherase [Yokenella regensburgei]
MSIELTGSVTERRNVSTVDIDRLSTEDMLATINKEDKHIADAVASCLPAITRLVDNAAATLSRGGRVVLAGAGISGRAAVLAASEYAPGNHHQVLGLIAGGPQAMLETLEAAEKDYDLGVQNLSEVDFTANDMLIGLSVSGKTPWTWGALRHAWSLGARVAVIAPDSESEAAQLADIVVAVPAGAEVIAGYGNPKAHLAQKMVLNMLMTGLAIRSGRVYSNLRVDVEGDSMRWQERQIAIVMEAGGCQRTEAKNALESCHYHCKTAILMVLTGQNAWEANALLAGHNGFVRLALRDAPVMTN